MRALHLAPLAALSIVSCAGQRPQREHAKALGIELRMTEVAEDGDFDVFPGDPFQMVDVNATLRLNFGLPPTPEDLGISPEWRELVSVLERWNAEALRYRALANRAAALQAPDAPLDPRFVADAQKGQVQVLGLLQAMVAGGILSNDDLNEMMGAVAGDPYVRIADVVNARQEELRDRTASFQDDLKEYRAVVRAALLPRTGGRQALHVPGYDKLPEGDYAPYDPLSVIPSPAEAERLRRELKGAQEVKEAIRELRANGATLREHLDELMEGARGELERVGAELEDDLFSRLPTDWKQLVSPEFLSDLRESGAGDSVAFADSVARLAADLDGFERLRIAAREARSVEAVSVILPDVAEEATRLGARVAAWPDDLATALEAIPGLLAAGLDTAVADKLEGFRDRLSSRLDDAARSLEASLPKTARAFESVVAFVAGARSFANGTDVLDGSLVLPRPLDELVPAELDLRFGGVAIGDSVEMSVEFEPVDADVDAAGAPPPIRYRAELTRAGWHRRYSGDVIFVQAVSGPQDDSFHSNVGLSLEWHNYDRENPQGWRNVLDPGIGFHAAFLDLDPNESIELGGGVNASIFDGLLRVGYGYDISADDDQEYWYLGFSLFGLLGQVKDFGSELVDSER